jgi:hypothetical protein
MQARAATDGLPARTGREPVVEVRRDRAPAGQSAISATAGAAIPTRTSESSSAVLLVSCWRVAEPLVVGAGCQDRRPIGFRGRRSAI